MKHVRKRLTYANVMSSLAVFLVLGGATAFAATKIGSSEIKANAITTGKIKKEAITAGKIKNAAVTGGKLAPGAVDASKINTTGLTVPLALKANSATDAVNATNAANAINATNAKNSNTVNGQAIFKANYRANAVSGATVFFSAGGLTITGSCAAGNDIAVTATTSKADSSIYTFVGSDANPANPEEADLEGGGFDPGVNFNLLAAGNGNINFVHFEYDALDGTIATGTLAVDENGIQNGCLATGDITVG
jgi:hypothetical protein